MKLDCYGIAMLFPNLEIMFIILNETAKKFGINSLEFLDSKRAIYKYLKDTDLCRAMLKGSVPSNF